MNAPTQALSIIETYATTRHMHKDALVASLMAIAPVDKAGKPMATMTDIVAMVQIAYRFDLDPWAKEIYFIPSRGRLQVYVPIDGYAKIVNRQPEMDGVEFSWEQDGDGRFLACTCAMYRKDRSRPTVVTEFMAECYRPDSDAWKKSPARMLRHRAFIQAARLTFGISGALDDDTAQPVIDITPVQPVEQPPAPKAPRTPPSPNGQPKAEAKPGPYKENVQDDGSTDDAEVIDPETGEVFEPEAFLTELDTNLASAKDSDELDRIWADHDVQTTLVSDKERYQRAIDLLKWHQARLAKGDAK